MDTNATKVETEVEEVEEVEETKEEMSSETRHILFVGGLVSLGFGNLFLGVVLIVCAFCKWSLI
jgi:hypothetical protein